MLQPEKNSNYAEGATTSERVVFETTFPAFLRK